MPVRNDADTGTVYTIGRPRPTLAFETAALFTAAVTTVAFAFQLARCGVSPLGMIGLLASIATVGLLAYDIGRKSGNPKGTMTRAKISPPGFTPDFSAYEFGPLVKLEPCEIHPLPADLGPDHMIVFYHPTAMTVEAWITGLPGSASLVRYDENPAKNTPADPDHVAIPS